MGFRQFTVKEPTSIRCRNLLQSCPLVFECVAMNVMLSVLCLSLGVQGLPQLSCSSSSGAAIKTLDELERAVYSVALNKDVAPTVIINRLLRKVKTRQKLDRMRNRHSLQELALSELLSTVVQMPPPSKVGGTRENLPPPREKPNRLGNLPHNNLRPSAPFPGLPGMSYAVDNMPGSPPLFVPAVGPPIFKPPPGVTIRVNPGGASLVFPDVTVTISPMMTVIEALRQADAKFRAALGLGDSADDIMTLGLSSYAGCFVVHRFGEVSSTERQAWKIEVADSRGKVIYESMCLPNRDEVAVKPGTTISLTYTFV